MLATKIPYLHCRNGIYYYCNQSVWKSLRTRCKKEAFRKVSHILFGSPSAVNYTVLTEPSAIPKKITSTTNLIKAPILVIKTATTFNRYLTYFNALYRWILANNALITENPFEGLKVIEKKKNISDGRKAYTPAQLKELFKLADSYGNKDRRYWLIMIGRYTGARMNEICQLKPQDITAEVIHIRGAVLKTSNAKRSIPTHPKLIELGLLDWVGKCAGNRLFHQWNVVRGSYSHAASRWFSRNNPSKSSVIGEKAEVDFHSLRHTVATELKNAGVSSQYAAQILGHSNGNITYDRYGKDVNYKVLVNAIKVLGGGVALF
jgi:integrase